MIDRHTHKTLSVCSVSFTYTHILMCILYFAHCIGNWFLRHRVEDVNSISSYVVRREYVELTSIDESDRVIVTKLLKGKQMGASTIYY